MSIKLKKKIKKRELIRVEEVRKRSHLKRPIKPRDHLAKSAHLVSYQIEANTMSLCRGEPKVMLGAAR
jgi:hypothetical protein